MKIKDLKFKIILLFINSLQHNQLLKKAEQLVFYLLIFSIPIQLGKHFWPDFSFVDGVRIDYLAPTLYVTDVLILILFCLYLFKYIKSWLRLSLKSPFSVIARSPVLAGRRGNLIGLRLLRSARNDIIHNSLFIILIIFLIIASFFSKSSGAAFYGVIKFLEFSFLAVYTAKRFNVKEITNYMIVISTSALLFSLIGITQFFLQHSMGGVLYYLGERSFSSSTPGIANMNIDGRLILRPYSTFAHPNIFAFYLLFVNVITLSFLIGRSWKNPLKRCYSSKKSLSGDPGQARMTIPPNLSFWQVRHECVQNLIQYFLFATFITSNIALFLTFSRITIFLYILYVLWFVIRQKITFNKKKVLIGLPVMLFFISLFPLLYFRYFDFNLINKDLLLRQELNSIAFDLFQKNPLAGVGLNNFYTYASEYQKAITPTLFQPVHNIYLFVLSQLGIIGFGFFVLLLITNFKRLSEKIKMEKEASLLSFYKSIRFLFIAFLIVGLFDHFFLTLQQGQLMLALIIGLANSNQEL